MNIKRAKIAYREYYAKHQETAQRYAEGKSTLAELKESADMLKYLRAVALVEMEIKHYGI